MLDAETKRRIDTCRDILVGKVPDPKSQVEQITIALIYKFMDDMDAEAEELGSQRTFFAGDYAKYGWAKLMAPSMGGFEVLALYSEAIQKMNENPGIPALFRDIFKNAYLPYRDPETLRLFLKEIDSFTYDHSERLGDAFEYLLAVLGSQGDAGQFRTPRHIIDFMVEVINPQKNESILDPACGTAGFLISAWKHILKQNTKQRTGDQLSPEERANLAANIRGYDISPDMVRLSLVNMYLHGFTDPHIVEYDTLTSEEKWNETADVILANPPFMSPKGGIKPHKRFSVQATRSEVLFVDYMAEHLSPQGRAAIVVPEGIIFQSGTAYKQLREMLVKTSLVAVVSLPAGVFNPYSGVKTSILILDKRLAKASDSVLFVKIGNDGFNLGAQRRAVAGGELPDAGQVLREWMQGRFDESQPLAAKVARTRIGENGEWNLSGERYAQSEKAISQFAEVKVKEISTLITKGTTPTTLGFAFETSGINFIKIEAINDSGKILPSKFSYISPECNTALSRSKLASGDVLFSIAGALGRCAVVVDENLPANINQALAIIRPNQERVLPQFLACLLRSTRVLDEIQLLKVGVAQFNLSLGQIADLSLPLPPLRIQQEIVAEIEGYQKIIDGARQVVENYQPRINVQPDWPAVILGEKCETASGGTPLRGKSEYYANGTIPWVKSGEVGQGEVFSAEEMITEKALAESSAKIFPENSVLVAMYGATAGQVGILRIAASTNQAVCGIYPSPSFVPEFLFYVLKAQSDYLLQLGTGGAQPNISQKIIRELNVPMPDIDTQRAIVAEIEAEQALVNANKELIARFEAKIKATINRVWGSSE